MPVPGETSTLAIIGLDLSRHSIEYRRMYRVEFNVFLTFSWRARYQRRKNKASRFLDSGAFPFGGCDTSIRRVQVLLQYREHCVPQRNSARSYASSMLRNRVQFSMYTAFYCIWACGKILAANEVPECAMGTGGSYVFRRLVLVGSIVDSVF